MVQQLSVDPPAGLSSENLRQNLHFGQGYEAQLLGQNYPNAAMSSLHSKMRTCGVRGGRQSNSMSSNKLKGNYKKLQNTDTILTILGFVAERKLFLDANTNDLDRLKTLLDSGIDPKSCDEFLHTALHIAISKGNTEVMRYVSLQM